MYGIDTKKSMSVCCGSLKLKGRKDNYKYRLITIVAIYNRWRVHKWKKRGLQFERLISTKSISLTLFSVESDLS